MAGLAYTVYCTTRRANCIAIPLRSDLIGIGDSAGAVMQTPNNAVIEHRSTNAQIRLYNTSGTPENVSLTGLNESVLFFCSKQSVGSWHLWNSRR